MPLMVIFDALHKTAVLLEAVAMLSIGLVPLVSFRPIIVNSLLMVITLLAEVVP